MGIGYACKQDNQTQSGPLVALIKSSKWRRYVADSGVLDVGCSNGRAVELLWQAGIRASGCDISSTVVAKARRLRLTGGQVCGGQQGEQECFAVGRASRLPFGNRLSRSWLLRTAHARAVGQAEVQLILGVPSWAGGRNRITTMQCTLPVPITHSEIAHCPPRRAALHDGSRSLRRPEDSSCGAGRADA